MNLIKNTKFHGVPIFRGKFVLFFQGVPFFRGKLKIIFLKKWGVPNFRGWFGVPNFRIITVVIKV